MANLAKNQVVTKRVRLSFVNLAEPKKIGDTDKDARYSVTCIIPKTLNGQEHPTVTAIKNAIKAAAEAGAQKHFGGRVPTNVKNTLKDGDTEVDDLGVLKNEKYPEYKGNYYIRVSTKFTPKIFDENGNQMLDPEVIREKIFSGCYGQVSMSFYAYHNEANRGVSAALCNVKFLDGKEEDRLTAQLSGDEFNEFGE